MGEQKKLAVYAERMKSQGERKLAIEQADEIKNERQRAGRLLHAVHEERKQLKEDRDQIRAAREQLKKDEERVAELKETLEAAKRGDSKLAEIAHAMEDLTKRRAEFDSAKSDFFAAKKKERDEALERGKQIKQLENDKKNVSRQRTILLRERQELEKLQAESNKRQTGDAGFSK